MNVYQIKNTTAENQYHGCGKAWAAIDTDGDIIAIKYMSDFVFDSSNLPAWVKAVIKEYSTISETPVEHIYQSRLAKIKRVAIEAGHPGKGPRGGHMTSSTIAREAKRIILLENDEQFSSYRELCRSELEELGRVESGMCSCFEFIV